jgi:hypothetical protein
LWQGLQPDQFMTDAHARPKDDVLDAFGIQLDAGLSGDEVRLRRQKFGPNRLRASRETPILTPDRDSSGESRFKSARPAQSARPRAVDPGQYPAAKNGEICPRGLN